MRMFEHAPVYNWKWNRTLEMSYNLFVKANRSFSSTLNVKLKFYTNDLV